MCRILLVEDDHQLRPLIVSLLDEAGYTVVPAGTITEAVRLVGEHNFCLAIIDLLLPNGDGMEIVRQIHQEMSVIIITGHPSHEARNQASVYDVAAFLEKPYNEEELIQIVDRTIQLERPDMVTNIRPRDGGRQVGDGVTLRTFYNKLSAISARVNTALELRGEVKEVKQDVRSIKDKIQEQNGDIGKMSASLKTMIDRTAKCDERGEDIAVLKEKARISSGNWQLIVQIIVSLITTGAAVFVTRAANQIIQAIQTTP